MAIRDIQNLISKGILRKEAGGGRSVNYELQVNNILGKNFTAVFQKKDR
jgi:hypothetical protein